MASISEPTERQHDIVEALKELSPKLAAMYESALTTLHTKPNAGLEGARVSIICHCMREVMNSLPGVLSDAVIPRPNPSSGQLIGQLPKLLAQHSDVDLGLDQDMVPVPKPVARALNALATAATQEAGRNQRNAAALVTGRSDTKHAAIKQWSEALEFFLGWTHLDRKHEQRGNLPSDKDILSVIRVVEDVVEVRTKAFFDNVRSLKHLLTQINLVSEDVQLITRFQAPTVAQVKEVVRKVPTQALRRAFYEGLENPLWVGPLAKEGAFSNPPEPDATDEGLVQDTYWPEINYLICMAGAVPAAIVDVLLGLHKSSNSWVRRGAFTIGAALPADQAARLQPLISSWRSSGFGWRTDPRELVDLAVNLLRGGQYEVGAWYADLLFKPISPKGRQGPNTVLEDYWYEEGLPRVAPVLGDDALKIVLAWLKDYERHAGHLKRGSDSTYIVRDTIRTRNDYGDSVEQALIDVVRDTAIKAMLVGAAAATSSLLAAEMTVARKVALFALGEAMSSGGPDDRMQEMLNTAGHLLFDMKSIDDNCRIEYGELARSVATRSPEMLEPLVEVLEPGSQSDEDSLRLWLGTDGANDAVIDARIAQYHDRWEHRWLSAVGMDALPEQMRTRLMDLDTRFGAIESPLLPQNRITTWTGPNSPIDLADMSLMSPPELVGQLASWHDAGDGFGPGPSHEGQARELTGLLATNPTAVAGVTDLVARLRPTYLRAILRGWQAALKAKLELDYQQVAQMILGVLTHGVESDFPAEGDQFDDDVDFRSAKQAAVELLTDLAKKGDHAAADDDTMVAFADTLITLADDETAWADYVAYNAQGAMDPLTASLNWQWPIRVRGLIHLISHGTHTAWYAGARAALERELSRDDWRGASWAALGEGLGRLLAADAEWVQHETPFWFGGPERTSTNQQIALTTAIAVHHYHPTLYDLLAPGMIATIGSPGPIVAGWHAQQDPIQKVGEWSIHAIIRGDTTPDDAVARSFFILAPPEVRGQATSHIAWSFMHAETVDDAIRDRFASLWDSRVQHVRSHPNDSAELNGFFWFVKCGKFNIEWWLPRLKEAIGLDPHLTNERHLIGKELAASADVDPQGAFDVLKLLLEDYKGESGAAVYDLTRNAVPMVLAKAIASRDGRLRTDAQHYLNELGESGNLQLENEVQAVITKTITQDDVED